MTASPATRIVELVELLNSYSRSYYVEGLSPVSDGEYDELYRELVGLEEQDPDHVLPESPTQRVGAPLSAGEGLKKVQHEVVRLGSGVENESAIHTALLLYKARALRLQGLPEAARQTIIPLAVSHIHLRAHETLRYRVRRPPPA